MTDFTRNPETPRTGLKFLFLMYLFYFIWTSVFPVCYVSVPYACLVPSEEGLRFDGTAVPDGWETSCGC